VSVSLAALSHAHIDEVVHLIQAPARRMLADAGATPEAALARVARLKGPEQIREMLERPAPDVLLGARDETGQLIGVGGLKLTAPGTAELHTLYLAESAQGRGLGRLLMQARIEHARHTGLDVLHLRTATSNVRIQRLAASLGFTLHEYLDSTTMPGVAWQVWRLPRLQPLAAVAPAYDRDLLLPA
jgi:RimJ/RimL family protein N-acetyltransferase